MSLDQTRFSKQIRFSPAGIAMTIFGVVLGVFLILPILLILIIAGTVAVLVFCLLSVYVKIVRFFQNPSNKDSEGRKNVKIRNHPPDQP